MRGVRLMVFTWFGVSLLREQRPDRDGRRISPDHEAPVVVAGGVDEVAEDFPGTPATLSRPLRCTGFVRMLKQFESVPDGGVQVGGDGGWRHGLNRAENLRSAGHMIQSAGIR